MTLVRCGLRSLLLAFLSVLCAAAGLVVVAPPAAAAVPAAPTGLAPAVGETVDATPVLSWTRSAGATGYDVEVSAVADFATKLYTVSTVNRRATPTTQLPMTQLYWRVRGKNADGTGDWATSSFSRDRIAGPVLQSPADGDLLDPPDEPVVLRWAPITGATSYTVEIDTGPNADWIGTATAVTRTTSYTPGPQATGSYAWRVVATLGAGQLTFPSQSRTYAVGELADVVGISPTGGQDVEDVVLDWDPVDGAVGYDVRVSTDDQFPVNTIVDSRLVEGTRYSPATTYDVDDYWWQVRAVGQGDAKKPWSSVPIQSFTRTWDPLATTAGHGTDPNPAPDTYGAPRLVFPANQVAPPVSGDMYYQWTPVRHATRYRLDVGPDPAFSPNTFDSCFTPHTTFVPDGVLDDECLPGLGTTLYWRVKALDLPKNVQGYYSPIQRFVYARPQVPKTSPAQGGSTDRLQMSWQPVAGAERYQVTFQWSGTGNGGGEIVDRTYSTSWSPRELLPEDAGTTFAWTVQAIDHNNVMTPLTIGGGAWSFTLVTPPPNPNDPPPPAALTPLNQGAAPTMRFPALTWQPRTNAAFYRLWVGTAGSNFFGSVPGDFPSSAATDTTATNLAGGDYDWFVQAFDADGNQLGSNGPRGRFTVLDPFIVTGQQVALSGTTLATAQACAWSLEDTPPRTCPAMPATPVVDWQVDANIAYYLVYVSRDRNFQNMVYGSYSDSTTLPKTLNGRWLRTATLPESQAGTAYHWFIRPCKAPGVCAQDPLRANHAFEKRSVPVATEAVTETSNDITLEWDPYLDTNVAAPAHPVTGERPAQEARVYQVQVATTAGFDPETLVDDVEVDQPTYTAFNELYPEGNLYWRVRAYDGDDRPLPWSETRTLLKSSPRPTTTTPTGTTAATEPLRWSATEFASQYRVQVYKNADTAASPANEVVDAIVQQPAFARTTPLPAGIDYVWRTQRLDASGNEGDWSAWGSFRIEGQAPELALPAAGQSVPTAESLFSWSPVPGAASYRYERRDKASGTVQETRDTSASAWAPTVKLSGGAAEWRVTSLDAAGVVLKASAWRDVTVRTAPVATTAATVSGSGSVGELLTGTDPVWDLPNVVNTYQWLRNGAVIAGATGVDYEVVQADVGRAISLRVTGTAAGYDPATSTSNAVNGVTGPAPTASTPPTINGSGKVGSVVTGTPPTWNQTGVASSYRWLRDGAVISGQTGSTYTVVAADAGKVLKWEVTGSKSGYSNAVLTTDGITATLADAPVPTATPTLSGTARLGTVVSVTPSPTTWDQSGVTTSYQWLRDGSPITGQTGTSYSVVEADIGKALRIRVTGKKPGHTDGVVTTEPVTAFRGAPPSAIVLPAVTGSGQVGTSLTAALPTWDQGDVANSYRWLRDGVVVSSNALTYAIAEGDVGKALVFQVTGRKAGYADAVVDANGVVATAGAAPAPSAPLTVTGDAKVGGKLAVGGGSFARGVTVAYQWLRGGAPIPGATASSYVVTVADVTQAVSLRVTASRAGYETSVLTTAPVAIAKMTSAVSMTAAKTSVKRGKRLTLSVVVTVPGVVHPTGQIRIKDGSKVVATVSLKPTAGKVTVKVKKLKVGKRKLIAEYVGDASTTGSVSKRVVVKVTG